MSALVLLISASLLVLLIVFKIDSLQSGQIEVENKIEQVLIIHLPIFSAKMNRLSSFLFHQIRIA